VNYGFTGTQKGMTQRQRETVRYLFSELQLTTLHHGDCIGADAQAHEIAKRMRAWIEVHPPSDDVKRAFCKGHKEHPPRLHLVRDRDIVKAGVDGLIATPRQHHEILRSGTWATIRYARKQGRHTWIVHPDGTWVEENYGS
jgi:hypothetical protein